MWWTWDQTDEKDFKDADVTGDFTVTIAKGTPSVKEAPTLAEDLTYTGEDLALVTAAPTLNELTSGSYTVYYKVSTAGSSSEWSTYYPTGKDAGTYKVYYKVESDDDNYGDIGQTEAGSVTIAKKPVTITWGNTDLEYNGEEQFPSFTVDGLASGDSCEAMTLTAYSDEDYTKTTTSKDANLYYVIASNLSNSNYTIRSPEEDKYYDRTVFSILPKSVSVKFSDNSFTYDGQIHAPTAELKGVIDGEDCEPDVVISGSKVSTINDAAVAIHAGTYYAKVTAKTEDNSIVAGSGISGTGNTNYVLKKESYSYQFTINPKKVGLVWYTWKYDEYGEKVEATADTDAGEVQSGLYVLVPVDADDMPRLVFNGKKQVPAAAIDPEELETPEDTGTLDSCTVTVQDNSDAIEADVYTVSDIDFSNADYTRDSKGAKFEIVPCPVKLEWYISEDKQISFEDTTDEMSTTYNGKMQEALAEVINIQTSNRGVDWDCEVTVACVSKEHFDGSEIEDERLYYDAGEYVTEASTLSDPYNYTPYKLNTETNEINENADNLVAHYKVTYTIDQLETSLVWSDMSKVYNASAQVPTAVLKDICEDEDGVADEVTVTVEAVKSNDESADVVTACNAGKYYVAGTMKTDGDRHLNYKLSEEIDDWTALADEQFEITKRNVTITPKNRTISYGDDPEDIDQTDGVNYEIATGNGTTGLINGDTNTADYDSSKKPGTFADNNGTEKAVIDGDLVYTYTYQKNGKYGTYKINADISGLTSDNYNLKTAAGTLKVKNKILNDGLVAKAKAKSKSGTIRWNGVTEAAKYRIYISKCNTNEKSYTPKRVATVKSGVKSYTVKNLKAHTFYKFYVTALDSEGKVIAHTTTNHFCTGNEYGKYTNPKSIKASSGKITVKEGGSAKVSASVKKAKSNKKLANSSHVKRVRYIVENPEVAKVSRNGVVKGVGTGWTRMYVEGANGIWKIVNVYVK